MGDSNVSVTPSSPARLEAFDSVRGLFMTLIATVHLLGNLTPGILALPAMQTVRALLAGTVGFVTVSGMVVGYAVARQASPRHLMIERYRKQALKLILIAHPIILLAVFSWKRAGGEPWDLVFRTFFVTDTLAIIFLAVVPLATRMKPGTCLLLGTGLMVLGRVLFSLQPSGSGLGTLLLDVLSGVDRHAGHVLYEDYPLLSLSGMFLVGSWLGHRFSTAEQAGTLRDLAMRCFRWLPWLFLLAADLIGVWLILRHDSQSRVRAFFYPDYDFSIYPLYLACVLAMTAWLAYRHRPTAVERFLAVFGRTSLFTYVAQYFVMQTLPLALRWRQHMGPRALVGYLVGGLAFLNLISRGYERLWPGRKKMLAPSRSSVAPAP